MVFNAVAISQTSAGYRVDVGINAYEGQWMYLGYHYGKVKALADSALVKSGRAVFSGKQQLPGGIYFVVSPRKELLFEVLVDKEQQFSITADTARLGDPGFSGSRDNFDFLAYTKYIQQRGSSITALQKKLAETKTAADSAQLQKQMRELNAEIFKYRTDYIKNSPGSFLSVLFSALQEPQIPPAAQHPGGKYDSAFAYRYFKSHYWDGISLSDERLLRTPFFEPRVERYFTTLVSPEPDSIKKEIDQFLLKTRPSREMYKFLLTHFVQKYINPQYMGQDAVFVYLFEKHINNKPDVDWFTEKYKKYIYDRAYSLMANLIGNPAWDISMTDSSGKPATLYETNARFTIICFWDPTCGHCKEMVPKLDSLYQNKWKKQGVKIFGVMTEGGRDNWLTYIREHNLKDWVHVYQSENQRQAERDSGKPGYRQLYDVYQTPVLYLLDENKRIIAKKLSHEQMDEVLTLKLQQKSANR